MKKLLSAITALVLIFSLSTVAFAEEQKVSEFSDVLSDHWAYTSIMAMTKQGLFSGKGQIVNGVGVFAPNDIMSRAEFVTVVVRALYKDELTALPAVAGAPWYANAYSLAIDKGLLNEAELDGGKLETPMNRQEMSMLLVRAAEKNGETPSQLVSTNQIADFNTVGTVYRDFVVTAYSMGMLCGTDDKGTYNPMGIMDRATAATVLYRLVEPSSRQPVDFNKPVTPPVSGPITIQEGQLRHDRLAQVGDTVIKADGTKVVLKLGKDGILGQDQGVAPDLGYEMKLNSNWGYVVENKVVFIGEGKNSLGQSVTNDDYKVNPYTGMGAWGLEWSHIIDKNPKPEIDGTKSEQLSADGYWSWSSLLNCWMLACN